MEIAPCTDSFMPEAQNDIACIGIIGSSDGPASVVFEKNHKDNLGAACSSLHFEKTDDDIEWRVDFSIKLSYEKLFTLL